MKKNPAPVEPELNIAINDFQWSQRAFVFGFCLTVSLAKLITLQGTNISRFQGAFEDDVPFLQVG